MLRTLADRWWVLLLWGVLEIVCGVLVISWPGLTLLTLAVLFGISTLASGVSGVVLGLRSADRRHWGEMVLFGVLAIIAGILALAWPGLTAVGLLILIATIAIVNGILEIAAAIRLRKEIDNEWFLGIAGAISVLFGIVILINPGVGAVAIALWIGIKLIATGILTLALSLRLRGLRNRLRAAMAG